MWRTRKGPFFSRFDKSKTLDGTAYLPSYHRTSSSSVYEPSDDTYLFVDTILAETEWIRESFLSGGNRGAVSLELGTGTGVISAALARGTGALIHHLLVDINPEAAKLAGETMRSNNQGVSYDGIVGDLSTALSDHALVVDILLFNPPYVPSPSSEVGDRDDMIITACSGGVKGREVLDRLLTTGELERGFLSRRAVVYILAVEENDPDDIAERLERMGFTCSLAGERRAMNERLLVIKGVRGVF